MKKILLGILVLTLVAACDQKVMPETEVANIEAGKAMAQAECSGCHGMDGRGLTNDIPNLAAQPADYLVDALRAYKDGSRHHAALQNMAQGMSDEDMRNIAFYFSGLPPLAVRAQVDTQPTNSSAYLEGAEIAATCIDCHGENGYSIEPNIPSLAGQQPAYLIVSTQEYARGERGHAEKEAMLQGLEQIDIEKMALYFAAQHPDARPAPPFGDPARGESLSATCGECHGARGVSNEPLVPSLAGQEPWYLVTAIKAYRDHDRAHEDMIADRNDSEIEDIAAYYAVQQPFAAVDPALEFEELAAKCDRCHGPDAGQSSMAVPELRGQNREYLVRVMKAYRDEDRGNSMMHKMSSNYSNEMIEGIATWYSVHPVE